MHSMRRTKATLIYRRTKNLRAVQHLLGHTKLESTVRYLGIEVEDALEIQSRLSFDDIASSGAEALGCRLIQANASFAAIAQPVESALHNSRSGCPVGPGFLDQKIKKTASYEAV
ncbi:Phage integrase family protein [Rhodoferax sp. OV413]|nr:Phage integrase family protein [Rhodoferax sp. OV413]